MKYCCIPDHFVAQAMDGPVSLATGIAPAEERTAPMYINKGSNSIVLYSLT